MDSFVHALYFTRVGRYFMETLFNRHVSNTLKLLFKELYRSINTKTNATALKVLIVHQKHKFFLCIQRALGDVQAVYQRGDMMDAGEFGVHLLQTVHNELRTSEGVFEIGRVFPVSQNFTFTNKTYLQAPFQTDAAAWDSFQQTEGSAISTLLFPLVRIVTACQRCRQQSSVHTTAMPFYLPIIGESGRIYETLEDSFFDYMIGANNQLNDW